MYGTSCTNTLLSRMHNFSEHVSPVVSTVDVFLLEGSDNAMRRNGATKGEKRDLVQVGLVEKLLLSFQKCQSRILPGN